MTPALSHVRPSSRYAARLPLLVDDMPDAELSIVNLAARQRMLSQRLILLVILAARGDALKLGEARSTLELFTQSQHTLLASPTQFSPSDAARVHEVYHGDAGVAATIEEFVLLMYTALVQIDRHDNTARSTIQQLIDVTDNILRALDRATQVFDDIHHTQAASTLDGLNTIAGELAALAQNAQQENGTNEALERLARKAAALAKSGRLNR
jgi:hypothetical protein